jgi:O-antigen/teichoic acid export membrane protein
MGFWSYGLVAGLVIGNLAGIILLGKGFQRRPLPRLHEVRDTIRENRRFILFSLPADVINRTAARVPMVVFPILFGLDQTGYLSLTYLVIAAPTSFVGTAVGEVFYSYAAREYEKTGTCLPTVLRIGKLLGALSILGFGTLFVLSGFVFGQVFGADWATAGKFAQAIMPMLAIAFISSPLSVVLYISGRQKEDLLWQIGFLITTVTSLYIGYLVSGDPVTALIILGASGFAMYLIYLVMIVRFATSKKITPAATVRQG